MNSRISVFLLCLFIANCSFLTNNLRGASSVGTFNGFNDSFKNQMAQLLGEVTNANTPETVMFKDKLLIGLISIDNTLSKINKNKNL
jgi:hypothetical protein